MNSQQGPVDLSDHRPGRLVGQGLVLRPWTEQDLTSMVGLFDDPDIALRTPLPSPFTADDARARLARAEQPDRLLLAVTRDGEQPLGEVLLTATGELGYMLGLAFRGQGVAARALTLLRDYAHQAVGLAVLQLRIEPDNLASIAVAERAGFRLSSPAAEVIEHKGRRAVLDLWQHLAP